MFISREYDYALRILRALAKNKKLTVKEICVAEQVPQPYSYKILKKLEKATFVKGYRGSLGGYKLTVQPQAVNLYDIYTAIEGELYINECLQEGYRCPLNDDGKHCTIHKELAKMQNKFIEELSQRSLADMLRE